MAQRELEDMVGKRGVPGQDRAVWIGANYGSGNRTFGTVVAVADPDFHRCKRRYAWSEPGVSTMIFKACDPSIATRSAVPAADDLANGTYRATGGADVEEPQS
jgi:hypothetical protein